MKLYKKINFILKIAHNFISQFGINLLKFKKIIFLPKFALDLVRYKKLSGKIDYLFPTIGEDIEASGQIIPHYFYQDLIVASYIFKNKPLKHVDIGSRLDGFVSHVASFREIEVFDIRENKINYKNIKFNKLDLSNINKELEDYADSVSCLHTIEHFGLGRYGDQIDPHGYKRGLESLCRILKKDGLLYISFPISEKNKVLFNSERIFHPLDILQWNTTLDLKLERFDYIDDEENIFYDVNLVQLDRNNLVYGCGIYTFKKTK
jgi:SAM-dependent methyltransferase